MCGTGALKNATLEICAAAKCSDWIKNGFSETLRNRVGLSVIPDLTKIALVGHSRGGKVVFGLAKRICSSSLEFSAIVGLDPVDGPFPPHILQLSSHSSHSLNLSVPTLIVGLGLSSTGCKPCAPKNYSHEEFFRESVAPAYHFVAPAYGHMDILNDYSLYESGLVETLARLFCKNGPSREPLRKFTAGIVVAFLEAFLKDDRARFNAAILNYTQAPVSLNRPEIYDDVSGFEQFSVPRTQPIQFA